MAGIPIVAWQKLSETTPNTLEPIGQLIYGVVDAGSESEVVELVLTNNYYSTDPSYEEVSKMENVRITTVRHVAI